MMAVDTTTPRTWRAVYVITALVVLWAMFNVVAGLGDHPLMPPDEGRYARASQVMLESGDYLVPRFDEEPRLQKPPLIYWLQSTAMALLGHNELAARLPSALATIGMIALTFWFAARCRDRMTGLIAAALLGTMPITLLVGRLAIIDPTLSLFWTAAIFAGYLMIDAPSPFQGEGQGEGQTAQSPDRAQQAGDVPGSTPHPVSPLEGRGARGIHRRWCVMFYLATALAVFAKGPIGLIPLAVVVVYLLVSGRADLLKRMGLWWGVPLTIAPVAAWALAVAWMHPEAWAVWQQQIIGRITTGSDHAPEPWYFYLPIVLVGMFPATAWLKLPWAQYRWADVKAQLRQGAAPAYMMVAVVVPLVILSAIAGKMPTYVLPLAAPLAIMAAANLRDWLDVPLNHAAIKTAEPASRPRLPDSMMTMAIAVTCGWIGVMIFVTTPSLVDRLRLYPEAAQRLPMWVAPLVVAPIVMWIAAVWWRQASRRAAAITLATAGLCVIWSWSLLQIEDGILAPTSDRLLFKQLDDMTTDCRAYIGYLGLADSTLSFYRNTYVPRIDDPMNWTDVPADHDLIIFAGAPQWADYVEKRPDAAARFKQLFVWHKPRKDWIILRQVKASE
ncbi:glycosyltransferase family 39 protein [Planctomycetales bacterium ZRK34]|nr:glycosyltransferase family 39 protein [Planctomycetales bacterium ZRK34]